MPNELPPVSSSAEPEMSNVHEAVARAAAASKGKERMQNFSVRLPKDVKEAAQAICERNATDLGAYLRECCLLLLRDYGHTIPEA